MLPASPLLASPMVDSPTFPLVTVSPPRPTGTVSLPHGFPSPPSDSKVSNHLSVRSLGPPRALPATPSGSRGATIHKASLFFPGPSLYTHQSIESMSTNRSSSSFASTSGFTDEWDSSSEATTVSSPNCSDHSRTTSDVSDLSHPRMWKVKGLGVPVQRRIIVEELEIISCPAPTPVVRDRNSTPIAIPSFMSALFAEPATPPRLKRFSASSQPSPTSPPFNLASEKASRSRSNSITTVGESDDADAEFGDTDEEIAPLPRIRKHNSALFKPNRSSIYKSRIPSIRFEGLSMDAVFAQVEEKMRIEAEMEAYEGATLAKKVKRRTRVFNSANNIGGRPISTRSGSSSTISSSTSGRLSGGVPSPSLSSDSIHFGGRSSPSFPLDVARSQPTRRVSARPAPLNVQVANCPSNSAEIVEGEQLTPTAGTFGRLSPPLSGAFSEAQIDAPARNDLFSPRIDGSFSPSLEQEGPSSLQEPLGVSASPSPALSTMSTLRRVELPEVCVLPPTPTPEEGAWSQPRSVGSAQPEAKKADKVVVVEGRRGLRTSTRSSGGSRKSVERRSENPRKAVQAPPTPPLSPAWSNPPSFPFAAMPGTASLESALPIVSGLFDRASSPPTPRASTPPLATTTREPFHSHSLPCQADIGDREDDPSDAEEALSTLLAQLNSPRTPPPTSLPLPPMPTASTSTSSGRPLTPTFPTIIPSITVIPRTPSPPLTLVQRRSIKRSASNSSSSSSSNGSPLANNATTRVYESDDSATRFEDAPLFIDILRKPLTFGHKRSARTAHKVGGAASASKVVGGKPVRGHKSKTSEDLRQQVLEQTIPVIVEEGEGQWDEQITSSSPPPPPSTTTRLPRRRMTTSASIDSTISISSLASSEGSEGSCYSHQSTSTTDSEGDGFGNEDAVVMMGHRVSCGYDIGMAM